MNIKALCVVGTFFISLGVNANEDNRYPDFNDVANTSYQNKRQGSSSQQRGLLNQQKKVSQHQEQEQNSQNSIDVSAQNEDNKQQSNVDELINSLAKKSIEESYMAQSCYNPAYNAHNIADASVQNEDSKQQRTITEVVHLLAESIVYRALQDWILWQNWISWQDCSACQYWDFSQGYCPNCAYPYCAYPFYEYGTLEQ